LKYLHIYVTSMGFSRTNIYKKKIRNVLLTNYNVEKTHVFPNIWLTLQASLGLLGLSEEWDI
jgi:hypothetical protein